MLDMDVVVPVAFAAKLPLLIDAIRTIEQRDRKSKVLTYFPRKGARPHPAVMLLRRATYWSAGGCDEDFVGSYGVTDVHFRWRASRTGNITLHSQYDQPLAKDLPELAQTRIRLDSACPPLVRNATRNKLLLLAKQSGRVRWSSEYLRFTWVFAVGAGTAQTRNAAVAAATTSTSTEPATAVPAVPEPSAGLWSPSHIIRFMRERPRVYFSRLFRDGGFRSGMEVGVAGGRFSEHFLVDNSAIGPWTWYMMEPFPNKDLIRDLRRLA